MATLPPEEAFLLDQRITDVQLTIMNEDTPHSIDYFGETIEVMTDYGSISVHVKGDPSKPTLLFYHDLGLNSIMNFRTFFNHGDTVSLFKNFRIVCVNALGVKDHDPSISMDLLYPSMDDMADSVEATRHHLGIKSFIGFGVGLGANVLARYAISHPEFVEALILINCASTACGWIEWGYQKLNIRHLRSGSMTTGAVDYLMWHHFGKQDAVSPDVLRSYREFFEMNCNPMNLSRLIESYITRSDLGIVRELNPNKKEMSRMIRCPVLNITSNESPHVGDSVDTNARLDPTKCSWMKIHDAPMILEEQPGKIANSLKLFVQGLGYKLR